MKSINNQNFQKIKLHGTLTTKELKKKINQNDQTSKEADLTGRLRKTEGMQQTLRAGQATKLAGFKEGADLRGLRDGCGLQWLSQ